MAFAQQMSLILNRNDVSNCNAEDDLTGNTVESGNNTIVETFNCCFGSGAPNEDYVGACGPYDAINLNDDGTIGPCVRSFSCLPTDQDAVCNGQVSQEFQPSCLPDYPGGFCSAVV